MRPDLTSSDKSSVSEKKNFCYIKGLKQSGKKRVNTYSYYSITISAYPSQPANKTADSWPHSIVVIVTSPALHVGCKINEDVWARVLIHLIGLILPLPPSNPTQATVDGCGTRLVVISATSSAKQLWLKSTMDDQVINIHYILRSVIVTTADLLN